jgi:hypothetical protein
MLAVLALAALAACGPEVGSPPTAGTGNSVAAEPIAPPPTSTSGTTTSPAATSEPAPRSFTVVASGDVLLHSALWTQGAKDAAALRESGFDLILGHHAHVVQPLQRMGDKWVAYGMGNEVAYQNQADDTRDGIIPRFTFTEVRPGEFRVTKAEVVPIHMWLDTKPTRLLVVPTTIADPHATAAMKASCRASRLRTLAVLGTMGAFAAGLTVVGGTTS